MSDQILIRLLDVSRMMAETRTLDPLLTYALDVALELFGAQYGYLVLVNRDNTLDFRVRRDRYGNDIEHPESQISSTIFTEVVQQRKPFLTASAMNDPLFDKTQSVHVLKLRSVMCVPMITHGNILGALYIENRNQDDIFSDSDLELLQYLASQAAVSIENAMLNDQLQALIREQGSETTRSMETAPLDEKDIRLALEQQRMRVISSFIQDASHQFRTPLAVINTNVDLLKRKGDKMILGHYLDTIHGQVQTMNQLIDSLVMMVKLDSNLAVRLHSLDLSPVVNDMANAFKDLIGDKHQNLTIDVPDRIVRMRGSEQYIRIAIGTLLDNAIKFTPEGGNVIISLKEDRQVAMIEVRDSGIGIASAELPQIFTRFYRQDKAGTTRGFGLGLSIAQRIAELHNGYIEVESVLEKGSIFRLIFPKSEV